MTLTTSGLEQPAAATGPTARVVVRRAGGHAVFHFDFPQLASQVELRISEGRLINLRARLAETLRDVTDTSAPYPLSPEHGLASLERLLVVGHQLGSGLCGDDEDQWLDLQERFQLAFAGRGHISSPPAGYLEVEVDDDLHLPPLELLPVFEGPAPSSGPALARLEQHAEAFLGVMVVLRRIPMKPMGLSPLERSSGRLRVRVARNTFGTRRWLRSSLPPQEVDRLQAHDGLDIDGPWPDRLLAPTEVRERLVDSFFDPDVPLLSTTSPGVAAVMHLVAHADTTDAAGRYTLTLSDPAGNPVTITLGELSFGYHQRLRRDRSQRGRTRSMVVLNACGSSAGNPVGPTFVSYLLANRHRAVVGTEAVVPSDAASDFAVALYAHLLGGCDLAEAMLRARRDLLTQQHDPTGLLYTYAGDPTLTVMPASG